MQLKVKVSPSSSRNSVKKMADGSLKIYTTEPPDKGKANKAVVRILAEYLSVPPSAITILRGHGSRQKIVEVRD